jgi:DNA-binding response OmpR family regulator
MDDNGGSMLLIDDEELNRDMLGRRLELEGHSVVLAHNGRQALSLLEQQPFDLMLLDVMMPEMSGLQVLSEVRKMYPALELPVIMVTANTASQDVVEALKMGANDYITKPVDFPVALARIEMQLKSKRSYQQSFERRFAVRDDDVPNADLTKTHHTGPTVVSPTSSKLYEMLTESKRVRVNIGSYEADGVIGQGAMGIVVKAYDPSLCRYVALKILAPDLAKCPTSRQRFTLEGRYGAALRHENVVTIYAVSEVDDVPYLVMEYISGRSLQDILDSGKTFTVEEIARIGRQTALGLAAAHQLRLIHRDVKPANLLLEDNNGCVRIADFGLARALDQDVNLSQKGLLVGTPLYMSPEQVDGKPLTPATDLFSLGSVLYALCTGRPPFTAESMSGILHAVAQKQPPPMRIVNPQIPDWLVEVIEKLHAKNPKDRFPSAAALAEHLATWSAE